MKGGLNGRKGGGEGSLTHERTQYAKDRFPTGEGNLGESIQEVDKGCAGNGGNPYKTTF